MIDRLRSVLEPEPRIVHALLFGSRGRGRAHARSDADVAVGLARDAVLSVREIGDLISRLEATAGQPVDLVFLDEASPGLAYRIFRDGRVILEKDRKAFVERKARAILEYLDFKPVEDVFTQAVLQPNTGVDETIAAAKIAAIRDAVDRIRATLPEQVDAFEEDRTSREIVTLNLFVALQECVSLATHWLADAGQDVPGSYREIFLALAERGALARELAQRLAAAAGFRNLVAHQYGVLDPARVHAMAANELGDLLEFCDVLARHISAG